MRLVCEGSWVLEELRDLEAPGVGPGLCSAGLVNFGLRHEEGRGLVGAMGILLTAL